MVSNPWGLLTPDAEVLGKLQTLALVVRAEVTVEAGRPFGQRFVDQPRHRLAVLKDERGLVAAHLEHALGALAVGLVGAEAGVEEAGVVDDSPTEGSMGVISAASMTGISTAALEARM